MHCVYHHHYICFLICCHFYMECEPTQVSLHTDYISHMIFLEIWKQSKAKEHLYTILKKKCKETKQNIWEAGHVIHQLSKWSTFRHLWVTEMTALKVHLCKNIQYIFPPSSGGEWTTDAKTCENDTRLILQQVFILVLLI